MITPESASRAYGLYKKREDGTLENLATPIWDWGKFYEKIVRNIFSGGSTEIDAQKGKKAVNYWWGMSADVIDVICSKSMPHGTSRLIEFLKSSIRAGAFYPFDGQSMHKVVLYGARKVKVSVQMKLLLWTGLWRASSGRFRN